MILRLWQLQSKLKSCFRDMITINADDFGRTQSINNAIIKSFNEGIITQTTIMVNMPYAESAILLSQDNNFFNNVGLHLNLDEGYPITNNIKKCKTFCKESGEFNGAFRKRRIKNLFLTKTERMCCKEEIEAQMNKYISMGFTMKHLDSHHHIHVIPSILPIVVLSAKKKGFQSMRIRFNLQNTNIIKNIFTKCINLYISRFFRTTDYFCDSVYFTENKPIRESIEVMCHPDIYEGKLVDVIGKRESGQFGELRKLKV